MLKWFFASVVSAVVLGLITKFLTFTDYNKRVYNHRPGPCHLVNGPVHGSEDIEVVQEDGIAFISSGIRYMDDRAPEVKGKIFLYDFNGDENKAFEVPVEGVDQANFFPHGLSVYKDNGKIRLFVVNHDKKFKHSIMIFDYAKKSRFLTHAKTITDEKFVRPNDLVAVGPESFIVSNDGTSQTSFWNGFEAFSGFPMGSVVFYNGHNSSYLLETAVSPNGITLNNERTHLFVSHINAEMIGVYKIKEDFTELTPVTMISTLTGADNLNFDADGVLWTGAHPVLKDAVDLLHTPDNQKLIAPSQVLRIEFGPGGYDDFEITEPYADDGHQLSGSSAAAYYKGRILIGTVFRRLGHCRVAHPDTIRRPVDK